MSGGFLSAIGYYFRKGDCVDCYYWINNECSVYPQVKEAVNCGNFILSRGHRATPSQGTGEFDASLSIDIDAFEEMTPEERTIYTDTLVRMREKAHNATLGQAPPVEATPAKAVEAEELPTRRIRKYNI
jgi:hypothetical protein